MRGAAKGFVDRGLWNRAEPARELGVVQPVSTPNWVVATLVTTADRARDLRTLRLLNEDVLLLGIRFVGFSDRLSEW
ncbi:MAG: hypothetical protein AAF756_13365 [Pseudomonadota bacterium]